MSIESLEGSWALILGASSGFGKAAALKLARKKINIFGVHMDRKSAMPAVDELIRELQSLGVKANFYNVNAADEEKRSEVLTQAAAIMGNGPKLRILIHSLAFGTLKNYIDDPGKAMTKPQMEMTLDVMANSLVYWTQDIMERNLFDPHSRIYGLTSSGSNHVWKEYGAVSAAKAAIESHVRQLAVELAPRKITINAIRAGVTDTPALRKIPNNLNMIKNAEDRNPMKRLTTPEDVAEAMAVLAEPGTYWMTGNVIGIDGGEDIIG